MPVGASFLVSRLLTNHIYYKELALCDFIFFENQKRVREAGLIKLQKRGL
jgi:hypothetical protein